jgi:hypothetical protein
VPPHAFLRRLVVVGRHDEKRDDGQPIDRAGELQRLRRRVRARAGDDRNSTCRELAGFRDDVYVLLVLERRRLASGACDDERLSARVDVKIDELRKLPVVNRAVCIHRRDDRHHIAGQHLRTFAHRAKKANDSTGGS